MQPNTWNGNGTLGGSDSLSTSSEDTTVQLSPQGHRPSEAEFALVMHARWVEDIVLCGVQPPIFLLGLVGNALCLVVLLYQGIQQTTNIILIGLCVADLLYVLITFRSVLECMVSPYDEQLSVNIRLLSRTTFDMVERELAVLSRLYMCFVSVERFIVVQFPLKASSLLTRKRLLVTTVLLWVFASVSCIPCFLTLEIKEVPAPSGNGTRLITLATAIFENHFVVFVYVSNLISPLFHRYFSIVLVFGSTFVILRTLGRGRSERKKMTMTTSTSDDQQQLQITRTLLSICIVFLVTNIPGAIAALMEFSSASGGFDEWNKNKLRYRVALTVTRLFMLLNSSVNFMLYVIFNRKFAGTARQLFCRRQK